MIEREFVEATVSLTEIATMLSLDIKDCDDDTVFDIEDEQIEIETPDGFKPITSYVVKQQANGWKLGDLIATSNHRVLHEGTWKCVSTVPGAAFLGKKINVVDIEVPDGNCYIANGWVNHNTTPGGWN